MKKAFREAVEAHSAGRPREAETILRGILARDANYASALHLMGELCHREGRIDEAVEFLEAAVRNEVKRPNAYNTLGVIYRDRGEWDKAIDCFDASIEFQLLFAPAHANLDAALAARGRPEDRFLVSVITPSRGNDCLRQAVESIQNQTYANIEHLVVADGPEAETAVRANIPAANSRHPVHVMSLPYNTGAQGFNGHRIYGAGLFLVRGRYVCFLDEDNWLDTDHIATLMARITTGGLQWAYALRKIIDADGAMIGRDDCQSLGRWPTWNRPKAHLVDTNCYLIRRDVALAVGHLWHHRSDSNLGPDFQICRALMDKYPSFDCSRRYSVNYKVENTEISVNARFFASGNAEMAKRYPDGFPWAAQPD